MSELFKRKIMKFLTRRDYQPLKLRPLARALEVAEPDYAAFKAAFEELRQAGRVVIGAGSLVSLPQMSGRLIGSFSANPKGFGFVSPLEPNAHGDLYIAPPDTAGAMTGDTVLAQVMRSGQRAGQMRYRGQVIDILQRAHDKFVGTLFRQDEQWLVKPDGTSFVEPIVVDDVTAKTAREKDKVVVQILSYPTEKYLARGVLIEVLGRAGHHQAEVNSIVRQYHLPDEFDQACLEQASAVCDLFDPGQIGGRDDITGETVITIDPPDAKDFDDAISLRKDSDGNWVLGVHIADVSCFVQMSTPLDVEARRRGNSAYLPGKTIPMLPELLSNGICSLQPGQNRFVKSVYITYDDQGRVTDRNFANSIICSAARLTYQQADKILRGKAAGFAGEVVALLKDMEQLARLIERRRIKNGMIQLELPETELIFDKSGRVVDAQPADTSYPHTIIEMFMVEANEAVAALLDRFGVPFIRRIHPDPDSLSLTGLSHFIKVCGFKVPRRLDRTTIQDLLATVKGTDLSYPINLVVLRSMERAEYSAVHIGHFALACTNYCHFTSPIRRYADLLVHRLLDCYLAQRLNLIGLEEVLPEAELAEVGKHITFTEQRAEDAEEELKKVLVLQMLSSRIGEELDCVVTGLTNFGVFVRCKRFGIEGLVVPADLGLDEWRYSNKGQCIVGVHSGKSIHLGQPMRVRIVSVNIPARQLNLAPVEPLVTTRQPIRKTLAAKNRRRKQPGQRRRILR
jgi:ribonuclease R